MVALHSIHRSLRIEEGTMKSFSEAFPLGRFPTAMFDFFWLWFVLVVPFVDADG